MITCHTLILWGDPKYRCSFKIHKCRIENQRPEIINFCYMLNLKDTAVFMYKAAIYR